VTSPVQSVLIRARVACKILEQVEQRGLLGFDHKHSFREQNQLIFWCVVTLSLDLITVWWRREGLNPGNIH